MEVGSINLEKMTLPRARVFIIVLNWNGINDTLQCLQSISELNYPNFEVIVVDNGSTDGSQNEIKAKYPKIVLIENGKNLGYAGGMNIGISYGIDRGADYLFLLNNDLKLAPDTLSILIKTSETGQIVGAVTPKVYQYHNPDVLDNTGLVFNFGPHICKHRGYRQKDSGQYENIESVDSFCGSGFLIKKSALDKVGTFDEAYFAYGEDIDLAIRLRKAGYKILYVPTAKTWHKLSATAGKNPNVFKANLQGKNSIRFMKKHATLSQWMIFTIKCSALIPIILAKYIIRGDVKPLFVKIKSGLGALSK